MPSPPDNVIGATAGPPQPTKAKVATSIKNITVENLIPFIISPPNYYLTIKVLNLHLRLIFFSHL